MMLDVREMPPTLRPLMAQVVALKKDESEWIRDRYNPDLEPFDIMERTSLRALNEIQRTEGNRDRAGEDASKIKFRSLDIDAFLRDCIESAAKHVFRSAGVIREDQSVKISGTGYYPPASYMGWHTNSCTPGTRIYLNHASENERSGLIYCAEDWHEEVTSLDKAGWQMRVFETGPDVQFWHAVFSYTERISVGFRVLDEANE